MATKHAPKMMSVTPTLTDPSMRNERSGRLPDSTQILQEMGESAETDALEQQFFNKTHPKTNEERKVDQEKNTGMSTLLIIAFALIVLALLALVVWMVVKQNQPKSIQEIELNERLRPHPQNQMPPMGLRPHPQMPPHMQQGQMPPQQMQQGQMQQGQMPPQMQQGQMPPHMQQQLADQQKTQELTVGNSDKKEFVVTPPTEDPSTETPNNAVTSVTELNSILSKTNDMLKNDTPMNKDDRLMIQSMERESVDDDEDEDEDEDDEDKS
jgi:hypothetical protein